MAWFNESLSSLTGRLQNLTKEVLSESQEEHNDTIEELKVYQEKIEELEALCSTQELEISALKRQNEHLRHRLHDAGLDQDGDTAGAVAPPATTTWLSVEQRGDAAFLGRHNRASSDPNYEARKEGTCWKELEDKEKLVQYLQTQLANVEKARLELQQNVVELEEEIHHQKQKELKSFGELQSKNVSLMAELTVVRNKVTELEDELQKSTENCSHRLDCQNNEFKETMKKLEDKHLAADIVSIIENLGDTGQRDLVYEHIIGLKTANQAEVNQLKSELQKLLIVEQRTIKASQYVQTESVNDSEELPRIDTCVQTDNCDCLNKEFLLKYELELCEKIKKMINFELPSVNSESDPVKFVEVIIKLCEEWKWKKDTLERKVTELMRESGDAKDTITILEEECAGLRENVERLAEQLVGIGSASKEPLPTIPENSEEAEANEQKVAQLEAEVEVLKEMRVNLEEDRTRLCDQRQELVVRVNNLEAELRNQENLEVEVMKLNESLICLESELEQANAANVAFQEKAKCSQTRQEELERELKEMKEQVANAEKSGQGMQKSLSLFESTITVLNNNVVRLQIDKRGLEEKLIVFQEILKAAQENANAYKAYLENLSSCCIEKWKRLDNLLEEEQRAKNCNSFLSLLHSELEDEIPEWEHIAILEQENTRQLEGLVKGLYREVIELRNKLEQKERIEVQIQELHSVKDQYIAEFKDLRVLLSQKDDQQEFLMREAKETGKEVEIFRKQLKEKEKQVCDLEEEKSKLEKSLADTILNYRAIGFELQDKLLKMEKFEESNREAIAWKEKAESSQNEAQLIIRERETLSIENNRLYVSNISLEQKVEAADNKIRLLENECQMLRSGEGSGRQESLLAAEADKIDKELIDSSEVDLQKEKQKTLGLEEEKIREVDLLNTKIEHLNVIIEENKGMLSDMEQAKNALIKQCFQNEEKLKMTKETIGKLSEIIKEKDQELEGVRQQMEDAKESAVRAVSERDQLVHTVQVKHQESLQYHAEIQRLTAVLKQEMTKYQQMATQYSAIVQKLEEQKNVSQGRDLQQTPGSPLCDEILQQQSIEVQTMESMDQRGRPDGGLEDDIREKYAALMNQLNEEQTKTKKLLAEVEAHQANETMLHRDVERLRVHLLDIEEGHTQETLRLEETVKDLQSRLLQTEEHMKSSSTLYKSASIRSNQQVETLQEQARLIAQQRDEVQEKLSGAEDQVARHAAALRNLQAVLEQFQRDKEREVAAAAAKVYLQVEAAQKRHNDLLIEIATLKSQLNEANEGLGAASRLGEQLEKKTEAIVQLKKEMTELQEKLKKVESDAQAMTHVVEGKVDKSLVKNVVLGYFLAPTNSREQVLHIIGSVLDFSDDERSRVRKTLGYHGTDGASGGWFKNFLHLSESTDPNNQSLSEAFVRFLENESIPQPKLRMLPQSEQSSSSSAKNASGSTSGVPRSSLLLADMQLPTFAHVGRNSSTILKDILKES